MPLVSPGCLPPSEHSRGVSVQDSGSPQPSWALRFLLVSIGLAAGLILARYVLKQVDLSAVSVLLRGLSPALLFGLVCLELSIHLTKAGRWRLLQAADDPPAFMDAFAAQTIGCLANILFPLRTDDGKCEDVEFLWLSIRSATAPVTETPHQRNVRLLHAGYLQNVHFNTVQHLRVADICYTASFLFPPSLFFYFP